jgi:hypothetical protein
MSVLFFKNVGMNLDTARVRHDGLAVLSHEKSPP